MEPMPKSKPPAPRSHGKIPDNVSNSVVKIQAFWKSFQCQKQFSLIKRLLKQNHNYFTPDDLKSRLTVSTLANKKKRGEKFVFSSGGIYKGEWLGGFRHGSGSMQWPDGAHYQGSWSFGYPFGFGKFVHVDGDCYSGEWKSPYAGVQNDRSFVSNSSIVDLKSVNDGYCKS
jgi:hypothetical protein